MISETDILNGNILIVDDQPVNVVLLERVLRGAGCTTLTTATDPRKVCALHREHHYDLILLDLQMPGMSGFEVMEELKIIEADNYLPVLVITAQPGHKLRALKAGARDFISKPFDLDEVLLRVHNMLEVRLLYAQSKHLHARAIAEQKIADTLLQNVLPQSIVERMSERPEITSEGFKDFIADSFKDVTVLFADIVDFTKFAEGVSVHVLMGVLNDIFSRFDKIADDRGLEKIKTSGDSYMVAAGLPIPVADHTVRAAHMALDMMDAMDRFNRESRYQLKVRIGIDSGAAVAGIVGKRKFHYDLWGDVVNTASRMESNGIAGRIQITDAVRRRLGDPFVVEARGLLMIPGKGEMTTWFLNSRMGV